MTWSAGFTSCFLATQASASLFERPHLIYLDEFTCDAALSILHLLSSLHNKIEELTGDTDDGLNRLQIQLCILVSSSLWMLTPVSPSVSQLFRHFKDSSTAAASFDLTDFCISSNQESYFANKWRGSSNLPDSSLPVDLTDHRCPRLNFVWTLFLRALKLQNWSISTFWFTNMNYSRLHTRGSIFSCSWWQLRTKCLIEATAVQRIWCLFMWPSLPDRLQPVSVLIQYFCHQ